MSTPHVLVTGASTGIGRACAITLRTHGFVVHGSVRTSQDADSLAADGIEPVVFDVVDDDAVAAGIAQVRAAAGGSLGGVVANAGIAVTTPIEDTTTESLRNQLDVNVLGVHRAVRPLIDDLVGTGGRIVLMSSVAGRVAAPLFGPYNASKFALEGYGDALRRELKPHGVHVALVEPGPIATPLWERSSPAEEDLDALHPRYRAFARRYASQLLREGANAVGPQAVADVVLHALVARRPRNRYCLPRDTRFISEVVPRLPSALADLLVTRSTGYR